MSLNKPEYREVPISSCGGVHVLLALWERFDLTFLLTQSGIFKLRGVPTWKLAFLVVAGLIARCSSCLRMIEWHAQEALLRIMLEGRIAQSTLSRFLTFGYAWAEFNRRRVLRLQQDPDTALQEGDVVALDDSLVPHPYAKKIPFLFWLFDHCRRVHLWASNLVAIHAVKQSGVEYPLFYALWDNTRTKFDLALEMLKDLRAALPEKLRLWLAVDRWYFNKDFLWALEGLSYDWVTKAKRNTVLYRLERGKKKDRYVRVNARQLLRQYYPFLAIGKKGLVSLAIPGLFLAFPREVETPKGKRRKKVYRPVAVVAVLRLTEDNVAEVKELSLSADQEPPATYKGAYLLLSNRFDAPAEVVVAYQKRWRIEIFFRNAKQELGLTQCHSTSENTIHAYFTLLFVAETLVRFAQWEHNKEGEVVTHGEIVRLLFRCRCWVEFRSSPAGVVVHPVMDAAAKRFQRLCEAYWPDRAEMKWFNSNPKWKQLPLSA